MSPNPEVSFVRCMYDRVGGETAAIKNSWSEADKPSPKKVQYNYIN